MPACAPVVITMTFTMVIIAFSSPSPLMDDVLLLSDNICVRLVHEYVRMIVVQAMSRHNLHVLTDSLVTKVAVDDMHCAYVHHR